VDADLKQIQELLASFNQTNITELNLKSGNLELTLRREGIPVAVASLPAPMTLATEPAAALATPAAVASSVTESPAPQTSNAPTSNTKKWVDIKSPMVGTFYRSPAPDEAPFVDVGETIRKGQTVCILEAMKLMNEIESEFNGQIVEILVQNGEPVEYEQVLMRINPG
jgi:acetyl-CoA carboxylase biotin carboxyl carrier protein